MSMKTCNEPYHHLKNLFERFCCKWPIWKSVKISLISDWCIEIEENVTKVTLTWISPTCPMEASIWRCKKKATLLNRITHHWDILETGNKSYRFKHLKNRTQQSEKVGIIGRCLSGYVLRISISSKWKKALRVKLDNIEVNLTRYFIVSITKSKTLWTKTTSKNHWPNL